MTTNQIERKGYREAWIVMLHPLTDKPVCVVNRAWLNEVLAENEKMKQKIARLKQKASKI